MREILVLDAADRSFRVEIELSGSAKVVYLFILETESYSAAGFEFYGIYGGICYDKNVIKETKR